MGELCVTNNLALTLGCAPTAFITLQNTVKIYVIVMTTFKFNFCPLRSWYFSTSSQVELCGPA